MRLLTETFCVCAMREWEACVGEFVLLLVANFSNAILGEGRKGLGVGGTIVY